MLISLAAKKNKQNTVCTRSHLSLNSLLGRLLDYRRDYVESDVGCGETERTSQSQHFPNGAKNSFMESSRLLNDARTHTLARAHDTHISPLGILNLLSFLYHRQPLSLSAIRTGNSVSAQSDGFRVKSVAKQIHTKKE